MLAELSAGDASGLPSVTRIIDAAGLGVPWDRIPPAKLKAAQERGTLVHQACEYAATDDLDLASVPDPLRGYVDAFLAFKADTGWQPILIETRLRHPLGFTGQPDTVGWLSASRLQLDLKTPVSVAAGPVLLQLAAYAELHRHNLPTEPLTGVAILYLGKDGRYRLKRREPFELAAAWSVFIAALCLLRSDATPAQLAALDAWVAAYPTT